MTLEEAISLVSYKLALKQGEKALEDPFLNPADIHRALTDQAKQCEEKVDIKAYMAATKMLKQHKLDTFREENKTFLQQNAQGPEITTTPSGLQYKILREGSGSSPQASDSVTVHYKGSLIDGTEFDSSYTRGTPASFALNKVIPGWREAILLMQEGAHYKLYLPQEIGYGERGNDAKVPGYATLIFEVELLKVEG